VLSHFLSLAIELYLIHFRLGASFTFELHCSLPSTPSLLLLFRCTYETCYFASSGLTKYKKIRFYIVFTLFPQRLNSSSSLLSTLYYSDTQYCELYICNIVLLRCNTNVLLNYRTMYNKWHNNLQYFLFHYLHSTSCTTNWLTLSLNAARWSKNYIMTHQHTKPRYHFSWKTRNPHGIPLHVLWNPRVSWNPCWRALT